MTILGYFKININGTIKITPVFIQLYQSGRKMSPKSKLFLCSCDNTQKINAKAIAKSLDLSQPPQVYDMLCRSQIEALTSATEAGEQTVICCTQESPVLLEAWSSERGESEIPNFINIRENAGWSEEGAKSSPKMAALIAESLVETQGTTIISMTSEG